MSIRPVLSVTAHGHRVTTVSYTHLRWDHCPVSCDRQSGEINGLDARVPSLHDAAGRPSGREDLSGTPCSWSPNASTPTGLH